MTCECSEDGTGAIVMVCDRHQAMVQEVVKHAVESVKGEIDKIKAERDELQARLDAIESDRNPGDRFDV